MHPAMVSAMVREIPRLQAAESLRRVTEYAIATQGYKPHDRRRILDGWQREAGGEPATGQRLDLRHKSSLRTLAAMGMVVG